MSNIIDINAYSPEHGDSFFFDCNIWIYLYYPLSKFDERQQRLYSGFLRQIISAKSTIFINSLVLSEFINRSLRFDYNQWKKNPENFRMGSDFKRNYVGSTDYIAGVESLRSIVSKILSFSEKYPDNFTSIDMGAVLNTLSEIDFNDSYYLELFNNKGIKIVTHDADFFNSKFDIDVVTANVRSH